MSFYINLTFFCFMKKHCGFCDFFFFFNYHCIPLGPTFLIFLPFLEKIIAFRKALPCLKLASSGKLHYLHFPLKTPVGFFILTEATT